MAQYIKYFTSNTFDRQGFVDMLNERMDVDAYVTEGGVILDREAFNEIKAAHMPHWAFLNREDINSNLHTRPVTVEELTMDKCPCNGCKDKDACDLSEFGPFACCEWNVWVNEHPL